MKKILCFAVVFALFTLIGVKPTTAGDLTVSGTIEVTGDIEATGNMRVTGNVGIGTTNPQAKLDVVGDAKISGGLIPDYDSGWIYIDTGSRVMHTYDHNFNSIPARVIIYTASSANPTWVRLNNNQSEGLGFSVPEIMWFSDTQVTFSTCCNDYVIYCDVNNPCPGGDSTSRTGYIKVLLWK